MVTVADLAEFLRVSVFGTDGPPDEGLVGVTHDSRSVAPGYLFCCVTGEHHDGHDFAAEAQQRGAVALLVERALPELELAQLEVPNVRAAMGSVAAFVLGRPGEALTTIGITGTNGKTTVANLLKTIFDHAGWRSDVIGTLSGARTTPEAPELQTHLAQLRASGVKALAMEVSSHALAMHRTDGLVFDVAVFTNLGHDHLDFHHTTEEYYKAKASLFRAERAKLGVINSDDPYGRRLASETNLAVLTYSLDGARDLWIDGPISHFVWRELPITLQLGGSHNVSNALAAATAAEAIGIQPVTIADALCGADPPRGRFEFVNVGQSFVVAVDYAHTPDALEAILRAGREVAGENRVIVVFGCGGDRDHAKRPLMGRAAEAGADLVVIASDNPRSEDPEQIISEIVAGLERPSEVIVCADRAAAISIGLAAAKPSDVVIIAGKGHETTQTIGDSVVEFDDREVAINWLRANQ